MSEEPIEWDQDIPMAGSLPIHWSVTVDKEGVLTGYISPYQQMPTEDEDGNWDGTLVGLNQPLRSHPNYELAAAAMVFCDIAYAQWIKPTISARVYRALCEQRDRQGGYEAGLKELTDDQQGEGYEP